MARLTGGSQGINSFDQWLIGTVSGQTSTGFSVGAGTARQIDYVGSGFTYDAGGNVTSGAITQINVTESNILVMEISDIRISVSTFRAFVTGGNAQGFLSSILSGSDTISHPGDLGSPDLYDGFAGNDSIDGAAGDDTLRGGTGSDTRVGREHWFIDTAPS